MRESITSFLGGKDEEKPLLPDAITPLNKEIRSIAGQAMS
jgi:hypothetical protein